MKRVVGTYTLIDNEILRIAPKLEGSAGWVLLALAARDNYRECNMTVGDLTNATHLTERTVQRGLSALVKAGYVTATDNPGDIPAYSVRQFCAQRASGLSGKAKEKAVPVEIKTPLKEEKELEGIEQEQNIKHTHIQISEPVPVSDSANATSDVLQIPDSNFWEEMPDLDELETLASLEHQAETVFVPSQESPIKKIELEEKAQPDLKKVSGAAAGPVGKIVDKSSARFNPREVDLPESIPREAWLEWCQHRTEKRSPLTPISVKKQLAQLLEFGATGQTPQESIDHAIAHSWQGFYPIRKARAAYVGKPQTTQEANERMVDSAAALYAACLEQDRAKAAQRSLNA